jgi:hypothetical protein
MDAAPMNFMRVVVTEQGALIPKSWLPDVREVYILKDEDVILVKPRLPRDPIRGLGVDPVECGSADGSEHHDRDLALIGIPTKCIR